MTYEEVLAAVTANPESAKQWFKDAKRLIRATARQDYLTWCEEVGQDRGWAPAAHHKVIIQAVENVISGKGPKRLLINAPPGSAKSTYTSELLPAHLLSRFPGFNLIGASNTSTLAEDFSERTLALIDQRPDLMPFRLRKRSAALWTTTDRGRYRAAGVGVAIAGNRADGVLIDDPVRSREDADSEVKREKAWNWFIADLRTRLKPNAWVIVIMTRWHEDDLGGRLLERQKGQWEVLNIPAQAFGMDADTGVIPPDALGRAPGEWLWGDDTYGYAEALRQVKSEYELAGAMRDWNALFQGRPTAGEGTVFKVANLEVMEEAPPGTAHVVRAWDLAATKKMGTADPDWTVGVKAMRTKENRYVVLDVLRMRGGPEEVERAIINTAKLDGRAVTIRLPQDPGQAGKSQVLYLGKQLAGFRIVSQVVTGDKATRAAPAASQVNMGNVSMVRASWNAAFREELASFPSATHDDQVDAFADAFSMVALNRPLVISSETLRDLKNGLGRKFRPPA
jgi:predicted phage terminase large subunit-like protein